jgi:hypothetical protein
MAFILTPLMSSFCNIGDVLAAPYRETEDVLDVKQEARGEQVQRQVNAHLMSEKLHISHSFSSHAKLAGRRLSFKH